MNQIIRVNDEVYIEGSDDVYIVNGYKTNEVYSLLSGKYIKETKYTLQNKKTGKMIEVYADQIKGKRTRESIKRKIDELLDRYNYYMELESEYKNGAYKSLAEDVMDKLERGDY
jgi:hypothetical protein